MRRIVLGAMLGAFTLAPAILQPTDWFTETEIP